MVGTNYFNKHLVAFISSYKYETLKQLFNSLNPSLDPAVKHRVWLQEIRSVVNNRITTEEERPHPIYFLVATLVVELLGYTVMENSTLTDVYSSLPFPEHTAHIAYERVSLMDNLGR